MKLTEKQLRSCMFLCGPTAAGKTSAALMLAKELNAEILSMDSMAIYRGMDIGTAKPSTAEQLQVQHHLIDLVEPDQDFSVADYIAAAVCRVQEVLDRGRVPLFTGGTGLYLRSLLRGLSEGPTADTALRRHWQQQSEEKGREWLHQQLQSRDPVSAAKLHPNDGRRMIRAIEYFELTGTPISNVQTHDSLPSEKRPRMVVWLNPQRVWLRERIRQRIVVMMQAGWLQETERLLRSMHPPGRTAGQALGYRELIAFLQQGGDLPQTVDQICIATRQFAKRQCTWFRGLEECTAVDLEGTETTERIVDRLLREDRGRSGVE